MGRPPLKIDIAKKDQQVLRNLLKGGVQQVRVVLRALALLQLAEDASAPQIAKVIPLTPQAIRRLGHRYERAGLGHHHHFQCLECQEVVDLEHCPISIPRGTTFPDGYVVDYHEITLYGTCPSCLNSDQDSPDDDSPGKETKTASAPLSRTNHAPTCDHPDHHHSHGPENS